MHDAQPFGYSSYARAVVYNMGHMIRSPLPSLTPSPMRRQASDALRAAIIAGELRPGDRLVELDLAARLGISRSPVREAIRDLETAGLVRSLPYKHSEVLGVSQEEIEEILVPLRLTLETFAFRKALPLLAASDFDALEALVGQMRRAGADGDAAALALADARFHELVIERSGQPHCLQIWRTIEPRVTAYFRRDAAAHDDASDVAAQHEQLLRALVAREEAPLLDLLEQHIRLYLAPGRREA